MQCSCLLHEQAPAALAGVEAVSAAVAASLAAALAGAAAALFSGYQLLTGEAEQSSPIPFFGCKHQLVLSHPICIVDALLE